MPLKNHPQKLVIISPDPFFSVLPIGPNPAQISIPVPKKSPTAGLLYNDFGTRDVKIEMLLHVGFVPIVYLPFSAQRYQLAELEPNYILTTYILQR